MASQFSKAKEQIIQEAKDAGWEIARRPDGVVDFVQKEVRRVYENKSATSIGAHWRLWPSGTMLDMMLPPAVRTGIRSHKVMRKVLGLSNDDKERQ